MWRTWLRIPTSLREKIVWISGALSLFGGFASFVVVVNAAIHPSGQDSDSFLVVATGVLQLWGAGMLLVSAAIVWLTEGEDPVTPFWANTVYLATILLEYISFPEPLTPFDMVTLVPSMLAVLLLVWLQYLPDRSQAPFVLWLLFGSYFIGTLPIVVIGTGMVGSVAVSLAVFVMDGANFVRNPSIISTADFWVSLALLPIVIPLAIVAVLACVARVFGPFSSLVWRPDVPAWSVWSGIVTLTGVLEVIVSGWAGVFVEFLLFDLVVLLVTRFVAYWVEDQIQETAQPGLPPLPL